MAKAQVTAPKVSPADLQWWLDLAPRLTWTWAKTYADTAPHDYVVLDRNGCPLSRQDFVRAARVIHTFGEPGRYYRSTNVYLTSPDGRWKWWSMDRRIADTDLINRATTDLVYGSQDAPRTLNPGFTEYDAVATAWDDLRNSSHDEDVRRRVAEHFGDRAPTTLEVGCGTGALLDLGITKPWRYTGIDPSQGMLNRLVLKHPWVHRVYPRRLEQVRGLEERYELVVAMDVPEVDVGRLEGLASELLIVR